MKRWTGVLAFGLLAIATGVQAQAYPTKPIRVLVPFAPGGVVDTSTRILTNAIAPSYIDTEQLNVDAIDAGITLDEMREQYREYALCRGALAHCTRQRILSRST